MYSCKMEPKWNHCQKIVRKWNHGVKSCFSSPKYISAVPNRLNMLMPRSPVNFRQIREGHILPYHVTWSHRLKIAIFKASSESLNMGRVCSVLMPVVTLLSFKMIGRPEVGYLGRGPQLLRSMYLCVRWNHLSDRIFSAGH